MIKWANRLLLTEHNWLKCISTLICWYVIMCFYFTYCSDFFLSCSNVLLLFESYINFNVLFLNERAMNPIWDVVYINFNVLRASIERKITNRRGQRYIMKLIVQAFNAKMHTILDMFVLFSVLIICFMFCLDSTKTYCSICAFYALPDR